MFKVESWVIFFEKKLDTEIRSCVLFILSVYGGKSMAEYKKLYGFQLVPERDMTLADQFYGILKEEILKGRWKIGERLPSFSDLSQMTGLSAVPIRQAMENLEKEGYIAKKERKGIFLKSVLPQDGSTLGNIGIVIEEISDT